MIDCSGRRPADPRSGSSRRSATRYQRPIGAASGLTEQSRGVVSLAR